jgi:hypothetical protein
LFQKDITFREIESRQERGALIKKTKLQTDSRGSTIKDTTVRRHCQCSS